MLLTVILGSGAYFYYSDVQRVWETCLAANPDLEYCVYSVQRDSGKISQVELLTPNAMTEDPSDFVRWKMGKDEVTVYNGRLIGAKAKWYVDYYKTYGEDEWVNLKRKSTKIDLEIEEFDTHVILRKTSEYYGTASLSGTGGWLVEEMMVGQNWHKYSVEWKPTEARMNTRHRLKWVVDSFGLALEAPRELKNEYVLNFDKSVIVNWLDASKDVEFAMLTPTNLEVNFLPKKGVFLLDPSLGIGRAVNDYFTFVSSEEQCFNCDAYFKLCNPDAEDMATDEGGYGFGFIKQSEDSAGLKEWYLEVYKTEEFQSVVYRDVETCEIVDVNGLKEICSIEKVVDYYEAKERSYWEKTSIDDIRIPAKSCVDVHLVGIKYAELGSGGVDWVPTVKGFEVTEFAWWNNSWRSKSPINNFHIIDANSTNFVKLVGVDFTDMPNIECADAADLTVVNETTKTEVTDLNFEGWNGTKTDTDVNVIFKLTDDLPSGVYEGEYYFYYNNTTCSPVPSVRSVREFSYDDFEDNDYTAKPKWIPTILGSAVGTSVDAKKNGDYGLRFTTEGDNDWAQSIILVTDVNSLGDRNFMTWIRLSDAGGFGGFYILDDGDNQICNLQLNNDTFVGQAVVFTATPVDNTWYLFKINRNKASGKCNFYIYDSSGDLIEAMVNKNQGQATVITRIHVTVFDNLATPYTADFDDLTFNSPLTVHGFTIGAEEYDIDTEPPSVYIFQPMEAGWVGSIVNIDVNIWDENAVKSGFIDSNISSDCFYDANLSNTDFNVYYSSEGGNDFNFSWDSTDSDCLLEFDVNMFLQATDFNTTAYRTARADVLFHVDNNAPTPVAFSEPQAADVNVQFTCYYTGARCKNLYYSLHDVNYTKHWGANQTIDVNIGVSVTSDGNHVMWFWADDDADNNSSPKTHYATRDTLLPTITIYRPIKDTAPSGHDVNQWFDSSTIIFDLNDSSSGIDISKVKIDINGTPGSFVNSPSFDGDFNCVNFDFNYRCEYEEAEFDVNATDYNIAIYVEDRVGNRFEDWNVMRWIVWPNIIWGNVNEDYASDASGITINLSKLVDQNIIPFGQRFDAGIFNIHNVVKDRTALVDVFVDLNAALPNDSNATVCLQKDRVKNDNSKCFDVNASSETRVAQNLAFDANRMMWWFFDLNILGLTGLELDLDYQYRARIPVN